MVLQAFIDDSRTSDGSVVLAGYITSEEEWAAFSNEWARLLTVRPEWNAFKMSRAAAGGAESLERAQWHYRVIERHVRALICVAIPKPAYKRVVSKLGLPKPIDNHIYSLGWRS